MNHRNSLTLKNQTQQSGNNKTFILEGLFVTQYKYQYILFRQDIPSVVCIVLWLSYSSHKTE